MRILVPKQTRVSVGGGQSWISNLEKALKPFGHYFTDNQNDYDVLLIAGATLVERDIVDKAVADNKPIILRIDNILEDGKNRNTGMPRLLEYAKKATTIVYQSEWAKRMLKPLCGEGIVIYNGVDTDIFYPRKEKKDWDNIRIFYSKYSRNETKQFHEVIFWFREYNLEKKDDTLVLVGRYADDKIKIEHPFEFHNGEDYEYQGVVVDNQKLATIMRSCDVAFLPYMFDACSNTILEAQSCGLPILYSHTGGTPEIIENGEWNDYRNTPFENISDVIEHHPIKDFKSSSDFKNKFGLEAMGEKWHSLFTIISK